MFGTRGAHDDYDDCCYTFYFSRRRAHATTKRVLRDARRVAGNENSGGGGFPPYAVGGETGRESDDRSQKTQQASDQRPTSDRQHRGLPHGQPLRPPPYLSN